ncbi:MAG: acyl-CoA dehydrogenase family protein, partial [Planctomycetota bacterium]
MRELAGLDQETLEMIVGTFKGLAERKMVLDKKLEWDLTQEFPLELIQEMLGEEIGLQLVFLPEDYGGLGGGAKDIAILSEEMAKEDLGVATAFLAISLGTDPIIVGCTDEQKEKWLNLIAEGKIVAYAVTEPEAGSNLQSIKTTAQRVTNAEGKITGYKINGAKQFISNGGYAEVFTVLANAPDGPTFFVAEKGTKGLNPGKHEDKHGIRCSNTAPVLFEDMEVPVENLIGGVEGQGLKQANQVFGYTRLMVAAFGLVGGVSALDNAVAYAQDRKQFGKPLVEFQGYTHKLLVPHAVRLEGARAYIEEVAARLDSGKETDLQVEGSIAKFYATEAGNSAADAAIAALGGYGYIREYEVEKIKRDVKITCIYEGTSEIQQNIIGLFRFRTGVRSKGKYFGDMAAELASMADDSGGPRLAQAATLVNDLLPFVKQKKLTRSQHGLFNVADMVTHVEVGLALCRKANKGLGGKLKPEALKAAARLFAAEAVEKVAQCASRLTVGSGADSDGTMAAKVREIDLPELHRGG